MAAHLVVTLGERLYIYCSPGIQSFFESVKGNGIDLAGHLAITMGKRDCMDIVQVSLDIELF